MRSLTAQEEDGENVIGLINVRVTTQHNLTHTFETIPTLIHSTLYLLYVASSDRFMSRYITADTQPGASATHLPGDGSLHHALK